MTKIIKFIPLIPLAGALMAGWSLLAAFAYAGFVALCIWIAVLIAKKVHEPDFYVTAVSRRQCPSCKAEEALEVTSDCPAIDSDGVKFREVVLACIYCDETYIVEATPKDQS